MKIEDSSHISHAVYDPDERSLLVRFRNGKTYAYQNFEQAKANEFFDAKSKGKFLHERVKPLHRVVSVDRDISGE